LKVFKEEQRFNQWWLIALFVLVYAKIGYDLVLLFKDNTKVNTDALTALIFSGVIIILVTILIFSITLKIRIDEKGVSYKFYPFHFKAKNIPWNRLEECSVRKYSPILEYGGWGLRGMVRLKLFGIGEKGRAYNIKGNIGIQMVLKDGSKILLGTQKMGQAKDVIKNYSYNLAKRKTN